MADWQPIAEVDDDAPYIIAGFYTVEGHPYARPMVADLRHKDWPKRIEFYADKQRVFPSHFLTVPTLHVEQA